MSLFNKFVFSAQHLLAALRDQPVPLQTANADLLPFGMPDTDTQNLVYIYRHGYISAFDMTHMVPRWVCWKLSADKINKLDVPRKDCFERDMSLENSPMPIQYINSGFDLGHMCDCEDLSYSVLSQRESFILTNIAPQAPFFNRGIWAKLEHETRKQVKLTGQDHWILAASVYDSACQKIDNITIPRMYEKIIVNMATNETKMYSFKHESPWGFKNDLSEYETNSLSNLKIKC